MLDIQRIQEYLQRLPEPLQAEVLDFVEYLLAKAERETSMQGEPDWSSLSLASAMRDMEDEGTPIYTPADLKVTF